MKLSRVIMSLSLSSIFLVLFLLPLNLAHAGKGSCKFKHRECFTEAGYPACYKRIDIEKYYQFVGENKIEMAEQIITDDKKCIKLSGNEKAFLQDKGGGYVKFGIRGQNVTFWASQDALFAR